MSICGGRNNTKAVSNVQIVIVAGIDAQRYRSMSQMLGVWSQELRNATEPPNSKGKPSELEKQLKVLSTALGSWSRQQQQLLDSMD